MALNVGWAPVALGLLALPALAKPQARIWFVTLIAVSFADSLATLLPLIFKNLQFTGVHWNWSGKLIDIAVMTAIAASLMATQRFTARDLGLTLRQTPGTGRALLFVVAPFLLIIAALTMTLVGNTKPPSAEKLYYQATLPGLAEELVWRGLLLAFFDRMFVSRVNIWGAEIGFGTIATALTFGLVHGVQFDSRLVLQTSLAGGAFAAATGLVLAWLRARTKSLLVPVLTHNATNLILESVPLLF
jgi:uncharacterized protein